MPYILELLSRSVGSGGSTIFAVVFLIVFVTVARLLPVILTILKARRFRAGGNLFGFWWVDGESHP